VNPNRWWAADSAEIYWLETTDRADIGVDLKAPQKDDSGEANWSYGLLTQVEDGDVVFHYRLERGAITAWSRAVGDWWEEDIVWGSHAAGARAPARRPGFRRGLEGPYPLNTPVTLAALRTAQPNLREIRESLRVRATGPLYFPFELSEKRPLRATQFYLTKLPADLVRAFPEMAAAQRVALGTNPATPRSALRAPPAVEVGLIGTAYREAVEDVATSLRNPWFVDPDIVDRGLRGHALTQNGLARHLRSLGFEPRSPAPGEPQFDAAWGVKPTLRVAEVKSLTLRNEEQQLRLGLGQLLRYRHILSRGGLEIRPYLVVERAPTDMTWVELCRNLGVTLAWPLEFAATDW